MNVLGIVASGATEDHRFHFAAKARGSEKEREMVYEGTVYEVKKADVRLGGLRTHVLAQSKLCALLESEGQSHALE